MSLFGVGIKPKTDDKGNELAPTVENEVGINKKISIKDTKWGGSEAPSPFCQQPLMGGLE